MSIEKITDEQIQEYINQVFTEEVLRRYEEKILGVMKTRYEKYPTERNNTEWLDYTNFVCRRRCQRQNEKDKEGK
jgi:hypothetical protein